MVTRPTVLFTSKLATLTASQLAGASIKSFELSDATLVILFKTKAGKLKLQAKDGAAGGIFQMETEFAGNIEFTHTLGPELFYFVNSVTGKINFGNGVVSPDGSLFFLFPWCIAISRIQNSTASNNDGCMAARPSSRPRSKNRR